MQELIIKIPKNRDLRAYSCIIKKKAVILRRETNSLHSIIGLYSVFCTLYSFVRRTAGNDGSG